MPSDLLPEQLCSQLQLSCRAGGRDATEVGVCHRAVGILELRMVECVEKFRAELQTD